MATLVWLALVVLARDAGELAAAHRASPVKAHVRASNIGRAIAAVLLPSCADLAVRFIEALEIRVAIDAVPLPSSADLAVRFIEALEMRVALDAVPLPSCADLAVR